MSEPKVTMTYDQIHAERAVASSQRDALMAQYVAEFEEFSIECDRLSGLGSRGDYEKIKVSVETPAVLQDKAALPVSYEKEGEEVFPDPFVVVDVVDRALPRLRTALSALRTKYKARVKELQRRHRDLRQSLTDLEKKAEIFEADYKSKIPPDCPKEDADTLILNLRNSLSRLSVPSCPKLSLDPVGIKEMDQAESLCMGRRQVLDEVQKEAWDALNETHSRLLKEGIQADASPIQSFSDFLVEQGVGDEGIPVDEEDGKILEKVDSLLAELVVYKDYPNWESLLEKAENIQNEKEAVQRRNMYEDCLLSYSRLVKDAKARAAWTKEIAVLIEEASNLLLPKGKDLHEQFIALRRAGSVVDLADCRNRLSNLLEEEKEYKLIVDRRDAFLDALEELGWETREEMEVAEVRHGKLVFRKQGDQDYALEVKTNDKWNTHETELVRVGDEKGTGARQSRRDKEREVEWCEDHESLLKLLERRGYESNFRHLVPEGVEHVVRVVPSEDGSGKLGRRRKTAREPRSRQRKP